jgi:hypothetical protein
VQIILETLSQKTLLQKIRQVEWLTVKYLSSNPSIEKKKKGHLGSQQWVSKDEEIRAPPINMESYSG